MRKLMIVKNIFLVFLFLFLLSSCSSGFNYEKSYASGNYNEIILQAESDLASGIKKTPLYYKMVSHYRLGEFDQAVECAQLYYAMFNDDKGKQINDALSIMLYHSEGDVEMSIYAGKLLTQTQGARADDYAAYFIALMDGGRFQEAADLYNEIRSSLSAQTAAFMCIAAHSSSTLITSNLEAWYTESGYSDDFRRALAGAANLMIQRGDSAIILPLAISCYNDSGNALIAILIGDIYIDEGDIDNASAYYSEAYEEYPQAVQKRISSY